MKRNRTGEVRISLFTDDMILYSKYSRNSTRCLLDVINILNKVVRYKINIQKISSLFCINNEIAEEEIRKIILPLIALQSKMMYLKNKPNEGKERLS